MPVAQAATLCSLSHTNSLVFSGKHNAEQVPMSSDTVVTAVKGLNTYAVRAKGCACLLFQYVQTWMLRKDVGYARRACSG